ncbi:non-ribosomal peptide synthetase [Roseibium sp. RKSG952]|uniref:non-ribosomal peptide synthetase n=1 Tax=Roseibium sp. RKSG952 TaxID=2529384 RepID=UPI001FCA9C16|nr:non-ribosomal peptide synthetase [Roseibium sp. RKSG952]
MHETRNATLGSLLLARASLKPTKIAYRFSSFHDENSIEYEDITYFDLAQRSKSVAVTLLKTCTPGDRALILCPPGLDYISAFLGCQLAGVVAVPAYPPRNNKHMERLETILSDAGSNTVLCRTEQFEKLEEWSTEKRPLIFHKVDEIPAGRAHEWVSSDYDQDTIAFLQYTSGTTGSPKGVMVQQKQVIENVSQIHRIFGFDPGAVVGEEDTICSWLPPYHDMGLVGTILYPLYAGMTAYLMTPANFVKKPKSWLKVISDQRVSLAMAPNFAWQLCCDEISDDDAATLDLSCLRHALNGAEPVRYETLDAFARKFAHASFDPGAFRAVYGMAETVLLTAGQPIDSSSLLAPWQRWCEDQKQFADKLEVPEKLDFTSDQEARSGRKIVSNGYMMSGHDLVVVDPETLAPKPDGDVGEILVRGPSIAAGYWNKPDLTREIFQAEVKGDTSGRGWLRTGDLGAVVEGHLYVLGRRKEMVIIRGQNYYAIDLEITANNCTDMLGHDRTIAFGVERSGTEQLVLVHELSRHSLRRFNPNELAHAIRRAVLDEHEIEVSCVVFIRPASLPRTTSGKLQRNKARAAFIEGGLSEVARWEGFADISILADATLAQRFAGADKSSKLPSVADVEGHLRGMSDVVDANALWLLKTDGSVVLRAAAVRNPRATAVTGRAVEGDGRMKFGLFFFGSDDPEAGEETRYDLLLKAAELADDAGLEAVWTPERHFGQFGGQYPSPVATSAALAARTKRISIRAGSVVLPLHHPVRVAEDWAVIDNLSGGRVGMSIASGWHARDFILMPGTFEARKDLMMENLQKLRALWRGEEVSFSNGSELFPIRIRPLPVQDDIPIWVTAATNEQTFREAGSNQLNVLTFLAQASPEALADKIDVYLKAFSEARKAQDPGKAPNVSVLVHTFLAKSNQEARSRVEAPMARYVAQATDLVRSSKFGDYKKMESEGAINQSLIDIAVSNFLDTRGLFGSPKENLERARYWRNLGISELACLVDFGLPADLVLEHLSYLFELDQLCRKDVATQPLKEDRFAFEARAKSLLNTQYPHLADLIAVEATDPEALGNHAILLKVAGQAVCAGEAPVEELETLIAAAFADVLGRGPVSRDTDFFQEGGNSLHVARLAGRLQDTTGYVVPLQLVFEHPTVRKLAIALRKADTTSIVPIEQVDRSKPIPQSFQQSSLWFLDRLDSRAGVAYNEIHAFDLNGALNIDALRRAVGRLVERHDSLRTCFDEEADVPVQIICDPEKPNVRLVCEDASNLSPSDLKLRIAELRGVSFDLKSGPLFIVHLLQRSESEYILLFGGHHTVRDGWSDALLLEDLNKLYEEECGVAKAELPHLSLQYADFAAWQRNVLSEEKLKDEISWWKTTLTGLPQAIQLPFDRPRPAVMDYSGSKVPVALDKISTNKLNELARQNKATLFIALEAAFASLLARLGAGEDFAIGTAVAGRPRKELENVCGSFVNTLALRNHVELQNSFEEQLKKTSQTVLAAFDHSMVPFDAVVEAVAPERSLRHAPLVQVWLMLHNTPVQLEHIKLGRATGRLLDEVDIDFAKFELSMQLFESGEGISGYLQYSRQVFDRSTAKRIAKMFMRLLESVADSPQTRLCEIPILDKKETNKITGPFLDCKVMREKTAIELFETHVIRRPDATAVIDGDRKITYAELDAESNRLARYLISKGIGAEKRVGVCLERSLELVVSVLAIFKVGGAYLPLDLASPEKRLAFVLADAEAKLVLTTADHLGRLENGGSRHPCEVLALDGPEIAEEICHMDGSPVRRDELKTPIYPDSLAYVIYTSGSTGQPKGVMASVGNLTRYISWLRSAAQDVVRPAVLMGTTIGFDMAVREILLPLIKGGSLICLRNSPFHATTAELSAEPVTAFVGTPLVLETLLDKADAEWLSRIEFVYTGGAPLPTDLRIRALAALKGADLCLGYGPTEATCNVTSIPFSEIDLEDGVPIGVPNHTAQVYVLDDHLSPAPVGVVGELVIGGDQVSQGYWGQPELTAEKFVPDPFSGKPGARLYKTGDRARWRTDGTLEFLGRMDSQVKIRGMRVELGEIEAALEDHDNIEQAFVIPQESEWGDTRLVAVVVLPADLVQTISASNSKAVQTVPLDALFDLAELKEDLARVLPGHMIPADFIGIDRVPLTPSGKVDLKALPIGEAGHVRGIYEEPRSATERLVAKAFGELLPVESIGRHDGFFDLGGHSLSVVRLVGRLEKATGKRISVRDVFEAPTVAALAALLDSRSTQTDGETVALADRSKPIPLSYQQERLWFLNRLDTRSSLPYNIEGAFEMEGPIDTNALDEAIRALVTRHEVFRTAFRTENGTPYQVIKTAGEVGTLLTLEDGRDLDDTGVKDRVRQLMARPFDLENGPLFRAVLISRSPLSHVLVIGGHHTVIDGWSVGHAIRELSSFYDQAQGRGSADLPELKIQYADYASWQRTVFSSERLAVETAWWRSELDGLPPAISLPFDRPRPAVMDYSGSTVPVRVSLEATQKLRTFAQEQGATLFIVLEAAFATLLSLLGGDHDIAIITALAGRKREEFEDLCGFFINTIALRNRIDLDRSFTEQLAEAKNTVLSAFAHDTVPFEAVVEALSPVRSLAHAPLAQVMLLFQNTPDNENTFLFGDTKAVQVDTATVQAAHYDLNLDLSETENGLEGRLVYASQLFDEETAQRIAAMFTGVLNALANNPGTVLRDIPLLDSSERDRLVVDLNRTERRYPVEETVLDLFEQRATKAPACLAIVDGDREISYGDLNNASNQLAHYLVSRGAVPGSVIGICLNRSVDLVTSLLAIWKAGCAYLPLDPENPANRSAFMLQDTGTELVITSEIYSAGFVSEVDNIDLVVLDGTNTKEALEATPGCAPPAGRRPMSQGLAYVLYTSGSTGQPKGVLVGHRELSNYSQFAQENFALRPIERVLNRTTTSFDYSAEELWWTLAHGHTVIVCPEEYVADPAKLAELLGANGVTSMVIVPALLEALVGALHEHNPSGLQILSGGEPLTEGLAGDVLRIPGVVRLINHYGPTEATINATFDILSTDGSGGAVSIGSPVSNTQVYVVDGSLMPVPFGVAGELLIGGAQVAWGYMGRPDLTAERFVADPFSGTLGSRLYRTGDLALWRPDGKLEFLGRIDAQFKIRGMRVEPGEIEAALAKQVGISQAVVVVRHDTGNETATGSELVAYLVPDSDTKRSLASVSAIASASQSGVEQESNHVLELDRALDLAALRTELSKILPAHMLPARFVGLSHIPMTASGKVNRKALPDVSGTLAQAVYEAPETKSEKLIAQVFEELLGTHDISRHDNFFDLGGHSLKAVELVAKLQAEAAKTISIKDVFEAPVVSDLAARMDACQRPVPTDEAIELLRAHPEMAAQFDEVFGQGAAKKYQDL